MKTGARERTLLIALVLLVASAVYLPALGRTGLRSSEGHRAIPGWHILETGELTPTRLFERAYVRKPPGVPWAIAASSAVLGRNEVGARAVAAVSSIAMSMTAMAFVGVWLGSLRWGAVAGLAQALFPRLWLTGRAAEIEAPHNLFTQLACFALVSVLIARAGVARGSLETTRVRSWVIMPLLLFVGLLGMLMTKGPAGLPVVGGLLASACLTTRSRRPLTLRRSVWAPAVAAGVCFVGVLVWIALEMRGEPRTAEPLSEFVWNLDNLKDAPVMPAVVLLGAFPMSLGLLLALAKPGDAHVNAAGRGDSPELALARFVSLGFLLTVGGLLVFWVGNPRYADPALPLLPVLIAVAARCAFGPEGVVIAAHRRVWRAILLWSPASWPVLLGAFAAVWVGVIEPKRNDDSGREPGYALAQALSQWRSERPPGAPGEFELWGDVIIDARPELLWYARERAAELATRSRRPGADSESGHTLVGLRPLWKPEHVAQGVLPGETLNDEGFIVPAPSTSERTSPRRAGPPGAVVLRPQDELAAYAFAVVRGRAELIYSGRVHEYDFVVLVPTGR